MGPASHPSWSGRRHLKVIVTKKETEQAPSPNIFMLLRHAVWKIELDVMSVIIIMSFEAINHNSIQ